MVEEHIQQAQSIHQQLSAFEVWSLQQAADLRAKAEIAEELDEDTELDCVPASADELYAAADEIESVHQRINGVNPWTQ